MPLSSVEKNEKENLKNPCLLPHAKYFIVSSVMGLLGQTGPSYSSSKITLHIEVRLALVATDSAAQRVHNWLSSNFTSLQVGQDVTTYSM